MSRTFHLTLRSPKGNRQVWVLRGPGVAEEDPDWPLTLTREEYKRLGWDSKRERGLVLVDNAEGTPAAEVRAVHRALYDLHQVSEIFQEGDRIIMPASKVRRWHTYEEDAPTFRVPRTVFYAQSFHILKEGGEKSNPGAKARKRPNPVDAGRPSTLRQLYGDRLYRESGYMPDTGMKPAVLRKLQDRGLITVSGPHARITWKGMTATEKGAGRLVPALYGEVGGYAIYDTLTGAWLTQGEIWRKVGGARPPYPAAPQVWSTWRAARDAARTLNRVFPAKAKGERA